MFKEYHRILDSLAVVIAFCLVLAGGCGRTEPTGAPGIDNEVEPPAAAKNVILIVVDTLRADRLGGKRGDIPLMPKLARFASGSWWFTKASSQAAWTKPSMVSIFTSLYPGVHNVQFGLHRKVIEQEYGTADALPDSLQTIASYLKAAGWDTAGIQTNANMHAVFGVSQGFDLYRFHSYPDFRAKDVTDAAIEIVKGLRSPYFLYLHYMDPHGPYDPPAMYRAMFGTPPPIDDKSKEELLAEFNLYYRDHVLYKLRINEQPQVDSFSASNREYIRCLYDGEARFTDDELTRLLEFLESKDSNSVIIITADHGEELWEHGAVGHGTTVYEELTHVPLIIRFPGYKACRIDFPVETIDIVPTLVGYLGLEPNPDWQGRDLVPLVKSDFTGERPVFSRAMGSQRIAELCLESVTVGSDKLIVNRRTGEEELYRLADDPGENRNLAKENAARAVQLRRLLEMHVKNNEGHPRTLAGIKQVTIDADIAKRLKAVGYL